ncbi:MAG TPA: alpha/beta hydrolase [Sphaerochaeta sp.]|nr:alpha/beta hydrolase [Sphaerochaeta sp.]
MRAYVWTNSMKCTVIVILGLMIALFPGCASMAEGQVGSLEPKEVSPLIEGEEAMDLSGYWQGSLAINPTNSLGIGFTMISTGEGHYEAMLQIPTQGVRNFAVSSVRQEETLITIEIEQLQASFSGTYDFAAQQIVGTFTQMGQSLPLVLTLGEPIENTRPQDPSKPYPYISEDIAFTQTPEDFLLAGTITRPEGNGPFPAVVLVSGSGSQNRDEALMGHRPFLVLSDALTRSGIVVLRYDDRGFGDSGGDVSTATSLDLADDAQSAVDHLKTLPYVDADSIGIIGHSEGAIIGAIVAQREKDLAFLVLMAGSGVNGLAVLEDQTAAILRAKQAPEAVIAQTVETNMAVYTTILDESRTLEERKESVLQTMVSLGFPPDAAKSQISTLFSPWYMTFLTLDPADYLQGLDIPVMILNGTKDTQVSATLHVPSIEAALLSGGNKRYTTKVYEGLNHLFQPAITGAPDEYASIEMTIDPRVLQDISSWIIDIKQNQGV